LFGLTIAERAANDLGLKVTIIDRRLFGPIAALHPGDPGVIFAAGDPHDRC